MIKKILFLGFIFVIFIFSCNVLNKNNQQNMYFKFSKENKQIKIPVFLKHTVSEKQAKNYKEKKYRKFIPSIFDSSEVNIFNSVNFNTLDFINSDNDIIKQISLPKISRMLFNFHYINNDSIILQYDRNYYDSFDSSIMLINDKGKIKQIYSLKNSGAFCSENPEMYNNDNAVYLTPNFYEQLVYKDGKIFLNFERKGCVGDPAYEGIPFTGYINMKENKYYPIKIEYPDIIYDGKHLFPPHDKRIFSLLAPDGDILYAFKYTPTILKYNTETGEIKKVQIKSTVFDTVYSFSSEKNFPKGLDFQMPYPEYFLIKYDKKNNRYTRSIVLPAGYGKFKFISVIADTAFNFIAEGLLPKHSMSADYNNNYKDGTNKEIIKQIKLMYSREIINKPLTDYVKTFGKINEKNYTAIFSWIDGSCESSIDGLLKYYELNEFFFIKNNTFLFLISTDKNYVDKLLKQHKLTNYINRNIFIDTLYKFGSYTNYEILNSPRVIKVRKNKILTDTIFESTSEGAENFQLFVNKSAKEQKALKEK